MLKEKQKNLLVHTSPVVMTKLRFEWLLNWVYLPDLAPCDFHLFPNLKKWLGRKKVSDDSEVIDTMNGYLKGWTNPSITMV